MDDEETRNSLLVFRGEKYDNIRITVKSSEGKQHSIQLESGRVPRLAMT